MASPIVSHEMRIVKRAGECLGVLIEGGLDADDLQAPIADVKFRTDLIRFWQSLGRTRGPVVEAPPQSRAREIMGQNFHGPDQVAKHFGVRYREAELAQLAEILFSEEVLAACKDTHILIAGYPLTILDIRERMIRNFYGQEWYNSEDFARKTKVQLRWHLLNKTDVPDSQWKGYEDQTALLGDDEEPAIACEMIFGMNLHVAVSGERLYKKCSVRCRDLNSYRQRVCVGGFDAGGLHVNYDRDWDRSSRGLSSARKINLSLGS